VNSGRLRIIYYCVYWLPLVYAKSTFKVISVIKEELVAVKPKFLISDAFSLVISTLLFSPSLLRF
jgi:hypothetical protein